MHFPKDPSQATAVAAACGFALLVVWLWLRRTPEFPYEPAKALLTPAERAFFPALEQAVGEDFRICPKVRVADVLSVMPGLSAKRRWERFRRISSKHLDFVLCDPETFQVVAAVELDDRSHRHASRAERDAFIDGAFTAAGLPILHVPAMRSYSARKLRSQILELLDAGGVMVADRH